MRNSASILAVLALMGCRNEATGPTQQYDSMQFVREGGGNIVFTVSPTAGTGAYLVTVSRIGNRDTTVTSLFTRDDSNALAFNALLRTLHGQINIAGNFMQDTTAIAGTWAYVYLLKGNHRLEITNVDAREDLMVFEEYVRARL